MALVSMMNPYVLLFLAVLTSVTAWDIGQEANMAPGRRTMTHLFEWRWSDIADECEQFLGPYGYGGVQVSPPTEHLVIWNDEVKRPWYERYQPVSYLLVTRSGNETGFKDMVRRCNNVGVRIYVDVILNHMTADVGEGKGTGGSHFQSEIPRYPAVPFGPENFNTKERCGSWSGDIENFNDPIQVRNCRLVGLTDLDQRQGHVRNKMVEFLNRLISFGVAGFRIDAAKHVWPADLDIIYKRLNNLNTEIFPEGSRPYIYQEVIDMGGEGISRDEYVPIAHVTEFRYGKNLGNVIRRKNHQCLRQLVNFGEGWAFMDSQKALVFVDNHDNQRAHSDDGIDSILTFFDSRMYKIASAFMLAWPYGLTRVMSSYWWPRNVKDGKDLNDWIGPPVDENYNILPVIRHANLSCGNGWICEHRWRQISNMVRFRNTAGDAPVRNWWDNDCQQIAFSRDGRGFIAINNEDFVMNKHLYTGLPPGTYCDVISGNLVSSSCTGREITVDNSGHSNIFIDNTWEDPVIAIHVDARLD